MRARHKSLQGWNLRRSEQRNINIDKCDCSIYFHPSHHRTAAAVNNWQMPCVCVPYCLNDMEPADSPEIEVLPVVVTMTILDFSRILLNNEQCRWCGMIDSQSKCYPVVCWSNTSGEVCYSRAVRFKAPSRSNIEVIVIELVKRQDNNPLERMPKESQQSLAA